MEKNNQYKTPHTPSTELFNKVYDSSTDILRVNDRNNSHSTYNELLTTVKNNTFLLKSNWGVSNLRDEVLSENGGFTSFEDGYIKLSTDTQFNSSIFLRTIERGQYIPGADIEAGIGLEIPDLPTNSQEIKWGYFDRKNGFYFGVDKNGVFIGKRKGGVEEQRVYQQDWNEDVADGTGVTGINLDLKKGNIFQIFFSYYGFGPAKFFLKTTNPQTNKSELILLHTLSVTSGRIVEDPNQPLSIEIGNGDDSNDSIDVLLADRQVSTFTAARDLKRRRTPIVRKGVTVGDDDFVPLISVRRKEYFPVEGYPNSVICNYLGQQVRTSEDIEVIVTYGNESVGDFGSIDLVPDSETALEVNYSPDSNTNKGRLIQSNLYIGGQGNRSITTESSNLFPLGNEIAMTIWAKSESGDSTVGVVFNFEEQW